MSVTKLAEKIEIKREPWEELEDKAYGGKIVGSGLGGLAGSISGRSGYKFIEDLPSVKNTLGKYYKPARFFSPLVGGAIGAGLGERIGEQTVRSAKGADTFYSGVGERVLPERLEGDKDSYRKSFVGGTTVGGLGGLLGYGGAAALRKKYPSIAAQSAKPSLREAGSMGLAAAGFGAAGSLLSRGILGLERGTSNFLNVRDADN